MTSEQLPHPELAPGTAAYLANLLPFVKDRDSFEGGFVDPNKPTRLRDGEQHQAKTSHDRRVRNVESGQPREDKDVSNRSELHPIKEIADDAGQDQGPTPVIEGALVGAQSEPAHKNDPDADGDQYDSLLVLEDAEGYALVTKGLWREGFTPLIQDSDEQADEELHRPHSTITMADPDSVA